MRVAWLVFWVFFSLTGWVAAQDPAENDPESLLEYGLAGEDADLPSRSELDDLSELILNPIDLNRATASDLSRVPGLSNALARSIIRERSRRSGFRVVGDLALVQGVDTTLVQTIAPFLRIVPLRPAEHTRSRGVTEVVWRIARRGGKEMPAGVGNLVRLSARGSDKVQFETIAENDPEEVYRWDPSSQTWGFDHVTATLVVKPGRHIPLVLVGDYRVSAGQGVTLGTSARSRKGVGRFTRVSSSTARLRSHRSAHESGYLRGAAVQIAPREPIRLVLFLSSRHLDARIDTTEDGLRVTSILDAGIHRSDAEKARKAVLRERTAGGWLTLDWDGVSLGASGYVSRLGLPMYRERQPRNHFRETGLIRSAGSLFWEIHRRRIRGSGEMATGRSGKMAIQVSAEIGSSDGWQTALLWRSRVPGFESSLGSGFSETTSPASGESGLYLALSLKAAHSTRISLFADQYRFPWLRSALRRPSTGSEWGLRLEHRFEDGVDLVADLRREDRETGGQIPEIRPLLDTVIGERMDRARVDLSVRLNHHVRLRLRTELRTAALGDMATRTGFLVHHDVRWSRGSRFQMDARLTLHDGEDSIRLYTFESGAPLTYSSRTLSGSGLSAYVLVRYRFSPGLTAWFKVSQWVRAGGKGDRRISAQIRRTRGH